MRRRRRLDGLARQSLLRAVGTGSTVVFVSFCAGYRCEFRQLRLLFLLSLLPATIAPHGAHCVWLKVLPRLARYDQLSSAPPVPTGPTTTASARPILSGVLRDHARVWQPAVFASEFFPSSATAASPQSRAVRRADPFIS